MSYPKPWTVGPHGKLYDNNGNVVPDEIVTEYVESWKDKLPKSKVEEYSGPGTIEWRFNRLIDELAKRFPNAYDPFDSSGPETKFLAAIDKGMPMYLIDEALESMELWGMHREDSYITLKKWYNENIRR
jgi:hypothetical protein